MPKKRKRRLRQRQERNKLEIWKHLGLHTPTPPRKARTKSAREVILKRKKVKLRIRAIDMVGFVWIRQTT
jgi:hypothetical protein